MQPALYSHQRDSWDLAKPCLCNYSSIGAVKQAQRLSSSFLSGLVLAFPLLRSSTKSQRKGRHCCSWQPQHQQQQPRLQTTSRLSGQPAVWPVEREFPFNSAEVAPIRPHRLSLSKTTWHSIEAAPSRGVLQFTVFASSNGQTAMASDVTFSLSYYKGKK